MRQSAVLGVATVLLLTVAGNAGCGAAERDQQATGVPVAATASSSATGSTGGTGSLGAANGSAVTAAGATTGPAGAVSASGTCNPLPVSLPAPSTLRASKKKVFAYYFPPFPVSVENKAPAVDYYSQWQYSLNSKGGAYDLRDRPIGRDPRTQANWKQLDFEVEIRRAIEVGIDGFIWEYHDSATDQRFDQLPALLAAAKAVDPGFKIMLSPDFPTTAGASPDPVVTIVARVKSDPSIYRLDDGRIVLAPFYPERQPTAWWDSVHDTLAAQGADTALVPIFLSWGGGTEKSDWNSHVYGYSSWGTRWVSGTGTYTKDSQAAHARGRIWMQPVAFEDTRSYDGRYWEASNSGLLRSSFETAIQSGADWVAMITWNDYTESWMSPSQQRGYAVTDVASYYIDWFKTGKAPAITQDALYYVHRSQRTDAPFSASPIGRNGSPVTMKVPNGDPASDQVELVAFLTTAGKLVITQGSTVRTMDAAAGVVSFKVPIVAGTTPVFQLQRAGTTVQTITSKTPIKSQVTFQDMMYHAGGGLSCTRP
jgi:hypothetical protein